MTGEHNGLVNSLRLRAAVASDTDTSRLLMRAARAIERLEAENARLARLAARAADAAGARLRGEYGEDAD